MHLLFKLSSNLASWLQGKSLESLPLDVRFWGVKMYKIRFWLGLCPRPHLRSLQGSISKGRGGEGERRVNEGEKKGRKKEFGPPTPIFTTDRRHWVYVLVIWIRNLITINTGFPTWLELVITSKWRNFFHRFCVAWVCQHQLSFLVFTSFHFYNF